MNHLICDANIRYENGAEVKTSFVTSYGGDIVAQTAPELTALINAESDKLRRKTVKALPKYTYPDHIVTSALMQRYAHYGIDFKVRRGEGVRVGRIDAQCSDGKSIFGYGLLLCDRLSRERAAAEKTNSIAYQLSNREKRIVEELNRKEATLLRESDDDR